MQSNPGDGPERAPRALLVGHFSTFGDVEVLQQTQRQLDRLGMAYDISPYTDACLSINDNWLDKHSLDPARYSHLLVICGPFTRETAVRHDSIFGRFQHCVHIGVNLTMVEGLDTFNPFEVLLERDSDRSVRPDLSFRENTPDLPVLGLCLATAQREYGARRRGDLAEEKLRRLIRNAGAARIEMDTGLPAGRNRSGIASGAEFEAIAGRLDVMLTTRLHGMVLSLKNGTPVIAIDPVAGGDKVTRQARELGWDQVFDVDQVSDEALSAALEYCLSPEAREAAAAIRKRAIDRLSGFDQEFSAALTAAPRPALRVDLIPPVGRIRGLRKRFKAWRRARRSKPGL